MKNILSKLLGVLFFFWLFSCVQNESVREEEEINFEHINWDVPISFDNTFDLREYDFDQLLPLIVKEFYETDIKEDGVANAAIAPSSISETAFFALNLSFRGDLLTLTPEFGVEPVAPSGDDEDCGGKVGDGWTSYGKCVTESCVEDKIREATKELQKDLKKGKCLDLRVKRNTFNARVCARIVDC
ncbi:MAG: hypothetical protein LBF69_02735 [Prevotellaceae bacterium]|nr:hypothetical protein [Prevotellaceae bacterium]